MTVLQIESRTGRSLVSPDLFNRLAERIVTDNGMDRAMSERIMDQALAFLGACAVTTAPLSPSEKVDIGWHTFLMYTKDYRDFCDRIAGRFIDHVPTDNEQCQMCSKCQDEKPPSIGEGYAALNATFTALAVAEAGYVVDAPLWESGGNCSQCHNGCHNDPPPDPKAI
jgi:hypothetical protein